MFNLVPIFIEIEDFILSELRQNLILI